MQGALEAAQCSPRQVDYINLHGTGTKMNDAAEAAAIGEFFGEHGSAIPCSSTKPVTGHCLGATPALEGILCLQVLQHQLVVPSANCANQDPACRLNLQKLQPRAVTIKFALSNSLGFWGHYASLLFASAAR